MGKTPIKVLSLFDGISCARQALHDLGIPVSLYYASEVDKYALQISAQRWPEIVQLGDVHIINTPMLLVRNIDLMIGGSPCQDLSIAGKRKGLDGERSGLFWEYVRVLREVQPRYFVLENVASMSKEARDVISQELGVEPIMIDAALVSGQRRKRLFWTNIPGVTQPEDKGILLRDVLEPVVDNKYTYTGKIDNASQGTRAHGIDSKSATLSALGGGGGAKTGLYIIPVDNLGNEKIKSNTLRTSGMGSGINNKHNWDAIRLVVPEATKQGYALAKDGDVVDLSYPNSKTRRGRVGEKSKSLMTSNNMHVFKDGIVRRLTPTECERLQSLPDGYTRFGKVSCTRIDCERCIDGERHGQIVAISDTQRYKALGNGFNADVISHILSFMPNDREAE